MVSTFPIEFTSHGTAMTTLFAPSKLVESKLAKRYWRYQLPVMRRLRCHRMTRRTALLLRPSDAQLLPSFQAATCLQVIVAAGGVSDVLHRTSARAKAETLRGLRPTFEATVDAIAATEATLAALEAGPEGTDGDDGGDSGPAPLP